jgi:cyanophycinase
MRATQVLAFVAMCLVSANDRPANGQTESPIVLPAVEARASSRIALTISDGRPDVASASALAIDERTADPSTSVLGALMLCGGGPLPETLLQTFFELGHAKQGSLVIIPSASSLSDHGDYAYSIGQWERFPWASVQVLHAKNRQQIEGNSEFVVPLQRATAVWISGGDQRRLAERYLGTTVEAELKGVVKRGGIIGGTSAGSAIASSVMISGGRQLPVIASGLDLLPGAIIDQHFSQRKRYERLASAVQQHPGRVGIGIDESTGLIVSKKEARVMGTGSVYIYSQNEPTADKFEPLRFESGAAFSLPEFSNRQE